MRVFCFTSLAMWLVWLEHEGGFSVGIYVEVWCAQMSHGNSTTVKGNLRGYEARSFYLGCLTLERVLSLLGRCLAAAVLKDGE